MVLESSMSRRRCLQGLAGAAAGMAAACGGLRFARAEAERPWKLRLSGSSINFSALPIEQACERIAALGFEAIDIWSPHAKCPHLDDVQSRLGAAGLQELLAKHRLQLYAFSVYAGGFPKYAQLLGQAGGGVAVRGSSAPCPPGELASRMRDFLEALKPEADLAAQQNANLAIENHGHALLDSVDSIKAFVDLNRNPRLGIALAPYHIQARQEPVVEAIRAAGPQLLFFYAWQHAPGIQQLPGLGPTDCRPWIEALAEINYRGYVNPFLHDEPSPEETFRALEKSRDYLKSCNPSW